MIAGYGALPVGGNATDAENVIEVVPSPAFTVMLVLVTLPLTIAGFGGFAPSSQLSICALISARRHIQSARFVIGEPLIDRNGSGSSASACNAPYDGMDGI